MVHADIVYNKNTKEINVIFDRQFESYHTKISEVEVINTDVVNKKAIARCNQAINLLSMSMFNHQHKLMWKVNPQGILARKSEIIRTIRICDANVPMKERSIFVTYSKPPASRKASYKKSGINISDDDVFLNVSYIYHSKCVHMFRYVEGARVQGLSLREHYTNFLNKNKESLVSKGFNELALRVLPDLEWFEIDCVTLEPTDVLSTYF